MWTVTRAVTVFVIICTLFYFSSAQFNGNYGREGGHTGCNDNGQRVPRSPEIRCKALESTSIDATCQYNNTWIPCALTVPPGTTASLRCKTSYHRDNIVSTQGNNVRCNDNGQWEPEPMRCTPVCGVLPSTDLAPLILNGTRPNVTKFPWHASLYEEDEDGRKHYLCGATIIKENLLLTAAHCVYRENTKKLVDANKIYVVSGNLFVDYDFPLHDPQVVKKRQVKNIYVQCNYFGLVGNFYSDIAMLELTEPFELSALLVPVCLDILTYNDNNILQEGVYGKMVAYNRQEPEAKILSQQILSLPYVLSNKCISVGRKYNAEQLFTSDKLCTGYNDGLSICNVVSGSGLVVRTGGLEYLQGISSVSYGKYINDTYLCENLLFTRISSHMGWINDVMLTLEENRIYPAC